MRTNHTPGPWHVVTIDGSIGSVEAEDGSAVAQAQPRGTLRNPDHNERRANTRLIAAAPELLEALIDLVDACDGNYMELTDIAKAAINKATKP